MRVLPERFNKKRRSTLSGSGATDGVGPQMEYTREKEPSTTIYLSSSTSQFWMQCDQQPQAPAVMAAPPPVPVTVSQKKTSLSRFCQHCSNEESKKQTSLLVIVPGLYILYTRLLTSSSRVYKQHHKWTGIITSLTVRVRQNCTSLIEFAGKVN